MLRTLSAMFVVLGLLFATPQPVQAQIQQKAYAPENLRSLSRSDQQRVIGQEYSDQSRGRRIPEDQLQPIMGIACPGIVYPYLRAIVSDVCTRAGFPPVILSEVNFQAMYEAQQAQAAAPNGSGIITSA